MSATPYSDAWRFRTLERMDALRVSELDLDLATGCLGQWQNMVIDGEPASLEMVEPVDEWLAKLEEQAEAMALDECTVEHASRHHRVRRVDVDLGPLADCDVKLWEQRR
jgi:hypothetical protein